MLIIICKISLSASYACAAFKTPLAISIVRITSSSVIKLSHIATGIVLFNATCPNISYPVLSAKSIVSLVMLYCPLGAPSCGGNVYVPLHIQFFGVHETSDNVKLLVNHKGLVIVIFTPLIPLRSVIFSTIVICAVVQAIVYPSFLKNLIQDLEKSVWLMYVTSLFTLFIGMFIVLSYNVWVRNRTLMITLIWWISLLKWITWFLFPKSFVGMGKWRWTNTWLVRYSSVFLLVVGLVLMYYWFFS